MSQWQLIRAKSYVVAIAAWFVTWATSTFAVEQLLPKPERSPDGKLGANVEWETLGQVGVLRIKIFDANDRVVGSIEVPQVRPDPADLTWLDQRWVMCESFLGERASGFYYVDALSMRGYLLEIYALQGKPNWDFDVTYADRETSFSVSNVSIGRTCLFPVVLGALPVQEDQYFRLEFCQRFVAAVDAYRLWLREEKWRTFDVFGEAAIRSGTGGLALCSHDGQLALVYFSLRAEEPLKILKAARLLPLPAELAAKLASDKTNVVVAWEENGRFTVRRRTAGDLLTTGSRESVLYSGTVEGATDVPVALALDTHVAEKLTDSTHKDEGEEMADAAEKNKGLENKKTKKERLSPLRSKKSPSRRER
ncbi:MAG: hypothetical protein ACP5QZ_12690 [Candidatus Sumerlaeaceae bacterium]